MPDETAGSAATDWRGGTALHLCPHTEWGSWSGRQYVCVARRKHGGDHILRDATPDEQRRIEGARSK